MRRLFQYSALHRGKSLPREQIFLDLWSDLPSDRAWTAFSTAYFCVRNAVFTTVFCTRAITE